MGQNNTSGKRWRTCSRFFPFWLFMVEKGAFDVISDKIIIPEETFMPFQRTNDLFCGRCPVILRDPGQEMNHPAASGRGIPVPSSVGCLLRRPSPQSGGVFPIPKRIK